jgi:TonB family protein
LRPTVWLTPVIVPVAFSLAAGAGASTKDQQAPSKPAPIASGFGAGAYDLDFASPAIRQKVEVDYPSGAVRERIAGEVVLRALVDRDGNVAQVQVQSPASPMLDQQAAATIKKWKFQPARLNGESVAVVVPISVRFYFVLSGEKLIRSVTESRILHVSDAHWPTDALRLSTPGLTPPRVLREAKPAYTSSAMQRKIQGNVHLEVVVGPDGAVSHARVAASLDKQLDSEALVAARQWVFTPCRLGDRAVACVVDLILAFKLV